MSDNKTGGLELPKPGAEHALLMPFVGTFRSEVDIFMGSTESHKSSGTMTNTWHVDGLYLHQDYVGDPAPAPFSAFVGRGYWGYNFGLNKYEGFWIDNASSVMQTELGTVDESGKVWTMTAEIKSPKDGGLLKKRSIIRIIDNDHNSVESFMTGPDGKEFRAMTIKYTRK